LRWRTAFVATNGHRHGLSVLLRLHGRRDRPEWTPYLFENTTQVYPWQGKPSYNLSTDLADQAIKYMKTVRVSAPDKPFFVYYVPGGTHSPHQFTQERIDKFNGKFDMGWNQLPEQIFANQKRLGVIPPGTALAPWPDDLAKWETLTAAEMKASTRARPKCSRRMWPILTTRSGG
jgi:arylsulfatase A-like enzyme